MLYQAYRSGAFTSATGIGDAPKVEGQEAGSVTEVVPPAVPGPAESPAQEAPGPAEPNAPGSVAPSVSAAPERSPDVSASNKTEAADAIKPASGESAPGEKDVLVIDFRSDSWMELRRAGDGKSMVSKVFKAGTTETFETSGPVTLIIGNASGVDVSYRGKPVEVKSAQGNNVARLNLK
jgi:cytoskeleton protein RodZ